MRILFTIAALFSFMAGFCQPFGNEWIDYQNQEYYKLQVNKNGMHRISRSVMLGAGVPLTDITVQRIQIFHNGEEIPIYEKYDNLGNLEYIEFMGKKNDGKTDKILYEYPAGHLNPYYSLFNDTASYFLTWSITTDPLRYTNETDNGFNAYSELEYCNRTVQYNIAERYNRTGDQDPQFNNGEGWTSNSIPKGASRNFSLTTGNLSNLGNVYFETSVSGVSVTSNINHHVVISVNNQMVIDTVYYSFGPMRKGLSIPLSILQSSNTIRYQSVNDLQQDADNNAVAYIRMVYPHNLDFTSYSNEDFTVPQFMGKKTVILTGLNAGPQYCIYDHSNYKRILLSEVDDSYKGVITGTSGDLNITFLNKDSVIQVNILKKVEVPDYSVNGLNSDFIIISHKLLWNSAEDYRNYRITTGSNVLLVDIDDLYNQFSYGINKHPLAIKNFVRYLISVSDTIPEHLFIIGKGIRLTATRFNSYWYKYNMIPSMGESSDILLTAGINGSGLEPVIPVGRLSAWNNDEVYNYLNKVQIHEANEPEEWMKNIIHLGGGYDTQEQQTFAGYLSNYEEIAEDTLFGGFVSTYLRTSSDPIEINTTESIRELINQGITLMTFFGHGAANVGFDQNIDHPESFQNHSAFPLILANSCLVGDIFLTYEGISEEWVFHERGSIGFLASTGESNDGDLNLYSQEFYKNFAYKNYGRSVGQMIQATIRELQPSKGGNKSVDNAILEFVFHGDPSVKLNSFQLPDLTIKQQDVLFTPANITTEIDSFAIQVVITNTAKVVQNPFHVKVDRKYPNGTTETMYFQLQSLYYKDTLELTLPVDRVNGVGINQLDIFVDYNDTITEYFESNNQLEINFLISSDDLVPIYPYKYAIWPDDTVTLKASSSDFFAGEQSCVFQIDTTDLFTNPLSESNISFSGGVAEWEVPFQLEDNTVYFWRVAMQPAPGDNYSWNESSFIYIEGKTGWSQDHFFQFKNDSYEFIDHNRTNRTFDFINTTEELHVRDVGSAYGDAEWFDTYFTVMGITGRSSCNAWHQMNVVVLDSLTLIPWKSDRGAYGHHNYPSCNGKPEYFFAFASNPSSRLSMKYFFDYVVPDGNYVLMYTFISADFASWEAPIFQVFEDMVTVPINITSVPDDNPYIFFCKKGSDEVREVIGGSPTDIIELHYDLPRSYSYGDIGSEIAGPSTQWNTLHWRQNAQETPTDDEVLLDLVGIRSDGSESTIIDDLEYSLPDITNLDDYVDASEFPYLKMNFFTRDVVLKTPSQLDKWQLTYDEVAETVINPELGYYVSSDTLQEGEDLLFTIATQNISARDMDSVLVRYFLINNQNIVVPVADKRMRAHPASDVLLLDTLKLSTLGLAGLNSLWVEINPKDSTTGIYDQLEQHHFNNFAHIFFYVQSDVTNPVLDVTFDGVHIMDGDIVSAKPEILVRLKDENQFLEMNDPSNFELYLTKPNSEIQEIIPIHDNDSIQWVPAELPDNSCEIKFQPNFVQDGVYKLKVRAWDASQNKSGKNDYDITFEVVNKASVTEVFNYPNPFSTSTRFVFELTGSEVPDHFEIQILTVTGKLVKVITQDDIGNLHIGRNITDYAWDGTDMYGDPLGNGIYFYRVITRLNGETIDKRVTGAEQYFRKGFGKMYLMR